MIPKVYNDGIDKVYFIYRLVAMSRTEMSRGEDSFRRVISSTNAKTKLTGVAVVGSSFLAGESFADQQGLNTVAYIGATVIFAAARHYYGRQAARESAGSISRQLPLNENQISASEVRDYLDQ